MGNYTHTSFGRTLSWVAAERGWNLSRERDKAVKETNRVRQWVFSAYSRRKLAVDVEECIKADEFCSDCNDCAKTYIGISLPEEFISAAGIWLNGAPIQANSRWREFQEGINRVCAGKLQGTYVGVPAPTERDIAPCGSCAHVGFQAMSQQDNGKTVVVQYTDINGRDHTNQIILKHGSYVQTSTPVRFFAQPGGVTLPTDLCGGVLVAQMDASLRILSEYKPWQHKPAYRRLSLPGVCCGQSVLVRGNRRYHDLYFDHETAEVDNELAVLAITRYLQFAASNDPTGGHQTLAKFHEAEAMKFIQGDQDRETGAATVNRFQHAKRDRRASGLYSNRR